jgi:sarcosine oxidase subunit gamma
MMTDPTRFSRRSFVHSRLVEQGAVFRDIGDVAVADTFPGRNGLATRLALIDLSPLPRLGRKGRGALDAIRDAGFPIPPINNMALRAPDGALIARLADTEVLVLPNSEVLGDTLDRIDSLPERADCYTAPRRDSHVWFILSGANAVSCLQKLCGVDLSPQEFPDLQIAQTSVGRISTILIREDCADIPAFHLLADSASALYFWDVLCDAMDEFFGAPAGHAALRDLRARVLAEPDD